MDAMQLNLNMGSGRYWGWGWGSYNVWGYNPTVGDINYEIDDYLTYRRMIRNYPSNPEQLKKALDQKMVRIQDALRNIEHHGLEHERLQAVILMDRLAARMREQDAELAAQEAA